MINTRKHRLAIAKTTQSCIQVVVVVVELNQREDHYSNNNCKNNVAQVELTKNRAWLVEIRRLMNQNYLDS